MLLVAFDISYVHNQGKKIDRLIYAWHSYVRWNDSSIGSFSNYVLDDGPYLPWNELSQHLFQSGIKEQAM